jgi:hypothetical protein
VIVQLLAADAELADGSSYLGLWSAEDGTEVWWNNFDAGGIASDGASLFVTYWWAGETCCFMSAIDARTGDFLWTETMETDTHVIGYLPSANMILLSVWNPLTATIGIDAETRQEVWRFRHFQNDCTPILPFGDDGSLACWGFNSGLNIFQPGSIDATPATDGASLSSAGIEQNYVDVTIQIDGQGLFYREEDAEQAAIEAIRDALAPYAECRVGSTLTFAWHPEIANGVAIAGRVNALLLDAMPDMFEQAATESFANVGPEGRAEIRVYFFRGCQAVDPEATPSGDSGGECVVVSRPFTELGGTI